MDIEGFRKNIFEKLEKSIFSICFKKSKSHEAALSALWIAVSWLNYVHNTLDLHSDRLIFVTWCK